MIQGSAKIPPHPAPQKQLSTLAHTTFHSQTVKENK